MSNWPQKQAGEFIASRNGSVNPKKFPDEEFQLFSIPSYDSGVADLAFGREIGSSKQLVAPGDVLISKIVPHIRRVWIVGKPIGKRQIASGEWIVFRSEEFFGGYLRHLLLSDRFHTRFMNTVAGVGGSLLRARPSQVKNIEIPQPPPKQQKRIAAVLDRADALRAAPRQALVELNTLTQSIFLDMFGDPATNPKNWPTHLVENLCNLVRGSSPRPKGDPKYFGGPVPRLMVADITRDGWLVTPQIDSLTEEGAKRSRPILAGTVVMAVSGNIGLVSRLAVDACVHDGFVAFKELDTSICNEAYLLALLHLSKSMHEKNKAGAIFTNLTTSNIKAMALPMPPMNIQKQYSKRVQKVLKLQNSYRSSVREVEDLFHSLQQRAFSGKL